MVPTVVRVGQLATKIISGGQQRAAEISRLVVGHDVDVAGPNRQVHDLVVVVTILHPGLDPQQRPVETPKSTLHRPQRSDDLFTLTCRDPGPKIQDGVDIDAVVATGRCIVHGLPSYPLPPTFTLQQAQR